MSSTLSQAKRPSTPVNPKKVHGRRQLQFSSFDEVLADVTALVASPRTRVLGNWPLDKLLAHLSGAINLSIDGISVRMPWYIRMVGRLIKGSVLKRMSPGVQLPKEMEAAAFPDTASIKDAMEGLRAAIGRLKTEKMTASHPVFGKLTHEQWVLLHLRHAELHLSFVLPN